MNLITYITGRKSRKEYIADIKELKDRCAKLADDLKHNATMYTNDLAMANAALRDKAAELMRVQSRYALSEKTSKEYLDRAECAERELTAAKVRAEKAESELDAMNKLIEAAERNQKEDHRRANAAERKYAELEQHLNDMYKEYESFRDRLNRRDV